MALSTDPTNGTAYDAAIEYARAEGAWHGRNAGSWVIDGNTTAATARAILQGIEDGDPAVLDTLPRADLSGEWADTLTGPQLAADAVLAAGVDIAQDAGESDEWSGDICDAYETAFDQAAADAIASAARAILA